MKCKKCGETDEAKFYIGNKSRCKVCITVDVKNRKERLINTPLSFVCKCEECGEEDQTKFSKSNKIICKTCSIKKRSVREGGYKSYICTSCGETAEAKFYPSNKATCKKCSIERNKKRYHNLPDDQKQRMLDKVVERQNRNIFQMRCYGGERRATSKGLEWNIDEDFLKSLWEEQKGLCYYSGITMSLLGDDAMYSISIERKDNDIGYVEGNVVLCCSAINRMKNTLTMDTFFELIDTLYNYRKLKNS